MKLRRDLLLLFLRIAFLSQSIESLRDFVNALARAKRATYSNNLLLGSEQFRYKKEVTFLGTQDIKYYVTTPIRAARLST